MENNTKQTTVHEGCSLGTIAMLLGVAFIVLKLCKIIAWSWVWILSPFWIYAIIFIAIIIIVSICKVIADRRDFWNNL